MCPLNLSLTKLWHMNPILPRRLRVGRRNCRSLRTRAIIAVVVLNFVFIFSLYRGSGSSRVTRTTAPPSAVLTSADSVPSVVRSTGATPLLDRLDKFHIGKGVEVSGSRELERCDGWTAGVPDVGMAEPQRWQIVVNGARDTFVFSAYLDSRSAS